MQRERLEGWMVQQVANADLAKETVIQLPTRTAPPPKASPRQSFVSPRRRTMSLALASTSTAAEAAIARSFTGRSSGSPDVVANTVPPSPRQRNVTQSSAAGYQSPRAQSSGTGGGATTTSIEQQWRAHFHDVAKHDCVERNGHVDRTQVLRWSSSHTQVDDCGVAPTILDSDASGSTSPLFLWGLPREHIVEYIRQSVLPSSWSLATTFGAGEWQAVPADGDDEHHNALTKALASLPPLALQQKRAKDSGAMSARGATRSTTGVHAHTSSATVASDHARASRGSQTARSPSTRPHTSPFQSIFSTTSAPGSPRLASLRCDDRITRVLNELRADPSRWEAFARDVKKYQEEQRLRHRTADKVRENRERVASPRLATTTEERKRQAEERMTRARRQRELLVQQEERRLEAKREQYEQRFAVQKRVRTADELANTVAFRRRKMWLLAITFVLAAAKWHTKFEHMKHVVQLAKEQTRAAMTIQRLWRKWKWHHASRHTVVIYTWLRKCLWKLLLKMRCRRRARTASVLQRFMLDHFSGSHETRNFNRMMVKWRSKVIRSQRLGRDFVTCTRARIQALSLWWDRIDHERQRSERQQHDRIVPTDDKEAEWTAMLQSRKLLKRRESSKRVSMHSSSSAAGLSGTVTSSSSSTAAPMHVRKATSTTTTNNNNNNNMSSAMAMLQLEHMNEKLMSMQQVLTPFEIQRLQQNAYHVVRVAKSIKLQLLYEFLLTARRAHMQQLAQFHEMRLCASFTREVRLDDARAIVQNSMSWNSLVDDHGSSSTNRGIARLALPTFQLFALPPRAMEELVQRGVQLTLERDHAQRDVVERQRQQRQSLDHTNAPALGLATKKRDGATGSVTSAASGSSNDVPMPLRKRQSARRLAFMSFKDSLPLSRTVLEDAADSET